MAITHVNTDYTGLDASAPGATVTLTMPPGGTAAQIAIAVLCSGTLAGTPGTWTAPAGWSQAFAHANAPNIDGNNDGLDIACFWALASAANPTFTKSGTVGFVGGLIADFAGCDTNNPIDVAGPGQTSVNSPLTVNALTPVTTGAVQIILGTDLNNGIFSCTGFTVVENARVNQAASLLYNLTALSSGVSTGTKSLADSFGAGSDILAISFLLKPAGAATGKLFLPPLLNGLSTGGPFFSNPIG